ncbi:MAG: glycerophosphodiester phosphodiesterase family protein [Chloroflexota bacterium]|nr:glycerophosphodiester phosphodiesterase family protein [Chloroflexota bacterium]
MLKRLPKPAIIAHRGASAYAPENTLSAFELAAQQQADAVELDIHLSADGYVIVIHDNTVDRTTDGEGLVSTLPLAALKELDAGSAYDNAFRGEKIPTLAEVFETIGKKIFINVELKKDTATTEKLTENVAKCVRDHNMTSRVLFSSFYPTVLWQIAKLLPDTPRGLLVYRGLPGFLARTWLKELVPHQSLHLTLKDAKQDLIDRVHRQGRSVFVYTINNPTNIQRLIKLGIDGIFTDDPYLALRTMAKTTAL